MAAEHEESTELLCPKKHALWQRDAKGHECDMCGEQYTDDDILWHCEQCDYDVCDNCEGKTTIGKIICDCVARKGEISEALEVYDKFDLEEFCNACFMDVRDIASRNSKRKKVGMWLTRMKQYIPQEEIPLSEAIHKIQQNFGKGVSKLEQVVFGMKTMVQPRFVSKSKSIADAFDITRDTLMDIKKLRAPRILVIGNASSGKSSLMNLLLGANLLKVGAKAGVTTTIWEMLYSEEEMKICTTTFEGETKVHHIRADSGDSIDKLLELHTRTAEDGSEHRFKDIKFYGKFDALKSGLSLLDTPGLNDKGRYDEYIQEVASSSFVTIVVLPCGDAGFPLNVKRIIETMKTQQGESFNPSSIFFVVTKADKEIGRDQTDILQGIADSIKALVGLTANMFIVNLKEALQVREFGMRSPKHTKLILGLKVFLEKMLTTYLHSGWLKTADALSVCSMFINSMLKQKGMPVKEMEEQCAFLERTLKTMEETLTIGVAALEDIQSDEVKTFATDIQSYLAENKDALYNTIREYHPKEEFESTDDQQKYIANTIIQSVLKHPGLQGSYALAQGKIFTATRKLNSKIVELARTVDTEFYFAPQAEKGYESKEPVGVEVDAIGVAAAVDRGVFRQFMELVDLAQVGPARAAIYACLGSSEAPEDAAGDKGAFSIGGIITLIKSGVQTMTASVTLTEPCANDISETLELAKIIIDETSSDEKKRATVLSEELFAVIQDVVSDVILKLKNDISRKQEMLDTLRTFSVLNQKEVLGNLTEYKTWVAGCIAQLNDTTTFDRMFSRRFC